jgi:hypothetical protein
MGVFSIKRDQYKISYNNSKINHSTLSTFDGNLNRSCFYASFVSREFASWIQNQL